MGAVRRLGRHLRARRGRLHQRRARRALLGRRAGLRRLLAHEGPLLARAQPPDEREPRQRLRRERQAGRARRLRRRGRGERRRRRGPRRAAAAHPRRALHRQLLRPHRPLPGRPRSVRVLAHRRPAALPGRRGRLPLRRRLSELELAVDELLRHADRHLRRRDTARAARRRGLGRPLVAAHRLDRHRGARGRRREQGRGRGALQGRRARHRRLPRQGGAGLPRTVDARELGLHLRRRPQGGRARGVAHRGRAERRRRGQAHRPATLRPGVEYTASYLAKWGRYADEPHGFDEGRSVGPVHFPPNAGVYQYGGGFPGDSWASSNYTSAPSSRTTRPPPARPSRPAPARGRCSTARRRSPTRRPTTPTRSSSALASASPRRPRVSTR